MYSLMNKKRLLFIVVLSVAVVCAGLFYWNTQRQGNYAKTRELFAPIYTYSGRLTLEEQNSYIEFTNSLMKVDQSAAKKYVLPKRDQLQLEAHVNTLHRNNPELFITKSMGISSDADVKSSNLRAGASCLQVGEESPLFFC